MAGLWVLFHPRTKDHGEPVVVAHVTWERKGVVTAPAASVLARDDGQLLLKKLSYLLTTVGMSEEALQHVQSQFWSFVPTLPTHGQ